MPCCGSAVFPLLMGAMSPLVCPQFHTVPGIDESTQALESDRFRFIPAMKTTCFVIWNNVHSETFSFSIKRENTAYFTELL